MSAANISAACFQASTSSSAVWLHAECEQPGCVCSCHVKRAAGEPRPYLDHVYAGVGYPVPAGAAVFPRDVSWEAGEDIAGAFHVEHRIVLSGAGRGRELVVLNNGEGKRWAITELAQLSPATPAP